MEGAILQFCRNLCLLGSISVIGIHQQRLVAVVVQHHAAAVNIHQMDPAAAFVIRDNSNRYLDLIGRRPRGNYLAARYRRQLQSHHRLLRHQHRRPWRQVSQHHRRWTRHPAFEVPNSLTSVTLIRTVVIVRYVDC